MAKKSKPGYKRCPKCTALVRGPRTKTCPKCSYQFSGRKKAAPAPAPAPAAAVVAEKPAITVTLEHVKAVANAARTVGGFDRLTDLLAVIKEVGGMKKFKDLMEAMTAPAPEADVVNF